MVKKNYLNKIQNSSATLNIPQVSPQLRSGSSVYSVGIVNSEGNGKRVSFSKALTRKLELTDTVCLLPLPEDGVVLISKEPLHPDSTVGKLSGNEKKICYSAGIVALLIDTFGLDFAGHTSRSFSNIQMDDSGPVVYAVLTLSSPTTQESGELD